jgi:hypothetical protein
MLEEVGIDHKRPIRPQQHLAGLEHNAVMPSERLPRVMSGLAQVGGAGFGFKPRPQGVDHLIACHALARLQAQQLHEMRGTKAGPTLRRELDPIDRHREATQQEDLETARRVNRRRACSVVHSRECRGGVRGRQAPAGQGTIQERGPGTLLPGTTIVAGLTTKEHP